jgi:hypothetical protein
LALNLKIARAAAARVQLNEDALRKAVGELPQLGEPGAFDGRLGDDLCVHVIARGHSVFVAAPRAFAETLSKSILGVTAGARGVLLYVVIAAIARADLEARCEGFVDQAAGDIVFPLHLLGGELRVIVPADLFVQ